MELRAHRGASYGVHTDYRTRRESADFLIEGDIRTDDLVEALRLVRDTLDRLGRQPLSPSELEAGKIGLLAEIAASHSKNADIAGSLAELHMTGLPPDFHASLAERINQTTAADLKAAVQRNLTSGRMTLAVWTNPLQIGRALGEFGYVEWFRFEEND